MLSEVKGTWGRSLNLQSWAKSPKPLNRNESRLAEVRYLLVENYSNSRREFSKPSFCGVSLESSTAIRAALAT